MTNDRKDSLPFYRPDLRRDCVGTPGALAKVCKVIEAGILGSLASSNRLTLALLRPCLGPEANLLGAEDLSVASLIENRIQGLGIAVKFSLQLDTQAVDEFYSGHPKEVMTKMRPYYYTSFDSKWEEFHFMMKKGNSTVLLLTGDDAIPTWRSQLGNWNVDANRVNGTIRGDLATDNYNDLVHGSDSKESLIRELDVIRDCITRHSINL
jgi:nucleoside diphosphate kinase